MAACLDVQTAHRRLLGDRIRRARRQRGLSQTALAMEIDSYQGTIWRIESGREVPRLETLLRIATALNTSVDYLCFGGRS